MGETGLASSQKEGWRRGDTVTTFPKAKGCYKEDADQLFPASAGTRLRKNSTSFATKKV